MNSPSLRHALKARYVFPVDAPPLADGVVTVAGGRIEVVGGDAPDCEITDLGNVALLPGLVNAHTHLEFSDLSSPLGEQGMPFADWIRRVIEYRRNRPEESANESVKRGLQESLASGVTSLGEIATGDWPAERFDDPSPSPTVFYELLGLSSDRIQPLMQQARQHLAAGKAPGNQWRAGLSPHAPYTVHPDLLRQACELSFQSQIPLAMHLVESEQEIELLQSQSGPLVDLLTELEAWHPSIIARDAKPLDYLQMLHQAHRALVIHGNYLNRTELEFLADRRRQMSVVYCPRTHDYFGHRDYPLSAMLELGVNVALGTDSRASNPDLSLLAEMRFVAGNHNVSFADVLRMGTLNGAGALGIGDEVGSISPDKQANLSVLQLPNRDSSDPHELLFDSDSPVQAVYLDGEKV